MLGSKKSNKFLILFIYLILLVVFNVIVFVVFKPQKFEDPICIKDFWCSYIFLTLAFITQYSSILIMDKKGGINAVFMGLPLFSISLIYLVCEGFLALIFMSLAAFKAKTPFALTFLLQFLLLCAFLVVAVLALLNRNVVNSINEKQKQNVKSIRGMVDDVNLVAQMCEDSETKVVLEKLAEDIRFSDPMSTEITAEYDAKLKYIIDGLKVSVQENDFADIKKQVKIASFTLMERNNKIANNK